ncbi:hypothetical protein V497_03805, partial [Pseudogymnoascus sp. VKM F-4516 (FW-969)]
MRTLALLAAAAAVGVGALPPSQGDGGQQVVIGGEHAIAKGGKKLTGRFLHIT